MDDQALIETGSQSLDGWESRYIHAATSDNTRRAYQSDIEHFLKEGGKLPTSPEVLEAYLRKCAEHFNPRTLKRRLTALRQWHRLKGHPDPTAAPLVNKTLSGIARLHGQPKQQAAALRLKDLDQIIEHLNKKPTPLSIRNKALLLVGYFGAFRRSELVALKWEQVKFESDGMIVLVPRSKTDQSGEGSHCVIPFGDDKRCPVRALIDWRQASAQWTGPIFRRISKSSKINEKEISSRYWNLIIMELANEVSLPNASQISSHSVRRGFATEAARLGASMPAIQKHGRWRSTKTVIEYIEAGRQFSDSAVKVLFEF